MKIRSLTSYLYLCASIIYYNNVNSHASFPPYLIKSRQVNNVTYLSRHPPSLSFQRPCTQIACLSAHRIHWGSHPKAVDLLEPYECPRSPVCKCWRTPHKSLRDVLLAGASTVLPLRSYRVALSAAFVLVDLAL